MREAAYYEQAGEGRVRCLLCPRRCLVKEGRQGVCRVRVNRSGRLYATNYASYGALALDPIEKKPLYHFYPGSFILSAGARGCNFRCRFCQNWQLAHGDPQLLPATAEALVEAARAEKPAGNIGLAYTYAEPLVWFEFVLETATLARKQGLKNVMVSNGFIEQEPLAELLAVIDAWNIDFKGFNRSFYRQVVRGSLDPVLATAEAVARAGCHLEITTLLVPGLNDDREEIGELARWMAEHLGKETPLHFSRYFPQYKLDLPPTPLRTLREASETASGFLDYVYLGNVPGEEGSNSRCPRCGQTVVRREGYRIEVVALEGRNCSHCGRLLNFVR